MSRKGRVVSVNVSQEKGTVKKPVDEIELDCNGIVGDAHAGAWHRQVSLLGQEEIDAFNKDSGMQVKPGEFAENISLAGIDLEKTAILDRFVVGQAELEVTQIGKECHGDSCAIFQQVGKCIMPKKGLFCRVIRPGKVKASDSAEHSAKTLSFLVITLSDRAFAGTYTDRSGPRAKEMLEEYLNGKRWHWSIDNVVLADEADTLREHLTRAISSGVDVIFTLGGTGVGPRDIAPETASEVSEKTIPGIMEYIRLKFGEDKPSALLSRSVAALAGKTQIYTLPGSVKAVEQYLSEIFRTLEHTIFMVHGVDIH